MLVGDAREVVCPVHGVAARGSGAHGDGRRERVSGTGVCRWVFASPYLVQPVLLAAGPRIAACKSFYSGIAHEDGCIHGWLEAAQAGGLPVSPEEGQIWQLQAV